MTIQCVKYIILVGWWPYSVYNISMLVTVTIQCSTDIMLGEPVKQDFQVFPTINVNFKVIFRQLWGVLSLSFFPEGVSKIQNFPNFKYFPIRSYICVTKNVFHIIIILSYYCFLRPSKQITTQVKNNFWNLSQQHWKHCAMVQIGGSNTVKILIYRVKAISHGLVICFVFSKSDS